MEYSGISWPSEERIGGRVEKHGSLERGEQNPTGGSQQFKRPDRSNAREGSKVTLAILLVTVIGATMIGISIFGLRMKNTELSEKIWALEYRCSK